MAENVIRLPGRIDTSNAAEWEKTTPYIRTVCETERIIVSTT